MKQTVIDLIRHGEPVGGRRYRGQLDDPLSEKGWSQMRNAVQGHQPWDVILTSPLKRCAEFAEEVATSSSIPLQQDDRLKEIGFGSWEGKTAEELMDSQADILTAFWRDPINNRPAGAEPLLDFNRRIVAVWQDISQTYQGMHVLVVCHAGVIRMCLQHTLGMPLEHVFRVQVANAGITRIQLDTTETDVFPRLIFHGGRL